MFRKNNNKAYPVNNLSEVHEKLYGFDDFDHGKADNKKSENRNKANTIQSQFDVGDYKDPEIKLSEDYKNKFYFDEDGVLSSLNPICPHCYTRRVTKWNLYVKDVISEEYCGEIIIQRYRCKRCKRTFILDLEDEFDSHSHISNSLKQKACEIKELNWSSLRDIAEYFKIFYGINISHETVRKSLLVIEGNEIDYEIENLSGYYGYDAQWVKINKEWKFRHVVYDTIQRMPIAELFADEETNSDVKKLIETHIPPVKRIGIVTDTKKGYDQVMRELNFKRHQYCTFHFKLNLNKRVREERNKIKREIKRKLKAEHPEYSDLTIKNKTKELMKPFQKEVGYALQFIYQLFNSGSFSKAEAYVYLIKANKMNFPKFIEEYLDETFFPVYKSYIYYLENEFKGKLESTDNKTEGYFRATLPKAHKRKFRTLEGVINQTYHRGNGYIKRRKQENEKKKKEEEIIKKNYRKNRKLKP